MLGSGAYSTVYRCVDKDSQEECAAKVIKLREMAADEVEALHIEVGILERIRHPNVIDNSTAQLHRFCIGTKP